MSRFVDAKGSASAPGDYAAIELAVMESARGRWFLEEYAKRLRGNETAQMLAAIAKLENAVATSQNTIAERLGRALGAIEHVDEQPDGGASPPATPAGKISSRQMNYFKQDEELFEAPAQPEAAAPARVTAVPAPVARGARLLIRRHPETQNIDEFSRVPADLIDTAAAPERTVPRQEAPALMPAPPEFSSPAEPPAKRRIVIIRHKPGEEITIPLQNEMAESA